MRLAATLAILAIAITAAPVSAATPNAKLKAQLRAQKVKVAKLQGQVAKDAAAIATLNGKVVALNGQITAQAQGGIAAVLAGSPDDLWAAVNSLWTAFPKRPDTVFCGYDKDTTTFSFGADVTTNLRFTANPCVS